MIIKILRYKIIKLKLTYKIKVMFVKRMRHGNSEIFLTWDVSKRSKLSQKSMYHWFGKLLGQIKNQKNA